MSWGEISCLKPCRMPENCNFRMCNKNCLGYIWDGETIESWNNYMGNGISIKNKNNKKIKTSRRKIIVCGRII